MNTENTSPWMKVSGSTGIINSQTNYQLISKPHHLAAQGIFHSGTLAGPGAPQTVFANEQLIDMLAVAGDMDPLAFRLQNMLPDPTNQRWVGVLQAAAAAAGWTAARVRLEPREAATSSAAAGSPIGHHGGSYAAVVGDILVNKKTGKITVTHLYGAQDAGLTVNPNLVENQMTGNLIQGASRALWEEMQFNQYQVTSVDWVTYPILRFADAPNVTPIVVQRTRPALARLRRARAVPRRRRDRERVLRRDRSPDHRGTDDPGRVRATLRPRASRSGAPHPLRSGSAQAPERRRGRVRAAPPAATLALARGEPVTALRRCASAALASVVVGMAAAAGARAAVPPATWYWSLVVPGSSPAQLLLGTSSGLYDSAATAERRGTSDRARAAWTRRASCSRIDDLHRPGFARSQAGER